MLKKLKLLFGISLAILVSYAIFLTIRYDNIPDKIVIKRYGEYINYGNKILLFLPVFINAIVLLFIWRVIKYPKKMIKLADTANEEAYNKMQLIIVLFSIVFTIISTYILFSDTVFN